MTLEELCKARDEGKTIVEAYFNEGELTPAGFCINPNWNKEFTKDLDRYKVLEGEPNGTTFEND